jgi:hypothetical protein
VATRVASLYAEVKGETADLERRLLEVEKKLGIVGRRADEASGRINRGMRSAGTSLSDFQRKLIGVGASFLAFAAVINAEKKVFDFAEEGAEIQLVEQRFARMAEQIGTTAGVLKSELGQASSGLISDFGQMKVAMELVSLGLVDNQTDVVRLARGIAELNMDMGELNLALANKTTRRFDQLGISLDGFNDKLQRLMRESGLGRDEVFSQAFLLQMEEQMDRMGTSVGTASGEFRRFHAAWEDFTVMGKSSLATFFTPMLENLNNLIAAYRGAEGPIDLWLSGNRAIANAFANILGLAPPFVEAQEDVIDVAETGAVVAASAADAYDGWMAALRNPPDVAPLQPWVDQTSTILGHLNAIQDRMEGGIQRTELGIGEFEALDLTQFEGMDAKLAGLISPETFNVEGTDEALGRIQTRIGEIATAAGGIQPDWFNDPRRDIDYIDTRLDELSGREIDIIINYIPSGAVPGFQHGGAFTVPSGFPNDSFMMGVSSGEHVTVQPADQRSYSITQNNYGTRSNPVEELERTLRRQI